MPCGRLNRVSPTKPSARPGGPCGSPPRVVTTSFLILRMVWLAVSEK